ncbi:hypothetical protein [Paenibacillus sp. YAF4_2]|uniref:hypothetical protein n=1 Tax=Paenibacillus sp. YAF4_2 TaxID=3233085 RepID=UPI003F96AEC4
MYITPLSYAKRTERLSIVSPIRSYGSAPFREEEPTRLPPEPGFYDSFDWNLPYRKAAESAAEWLLHSRQAQLTIRTSSRLIKHNPSLVVLEELLQRVVATINGLHIRYKDLEAYLKPELWSAIEEAMQHSDAKQFGLTKESENWHIDFPNSFPVESSIPLLIGPRGWMTGLHKALEEPLSVKALDLLRGDIPLLQPYSCYYSSMKIYWPFPTSGMLLNRLL